MLYFSAMNYRKHSNEREYQRDVFMCSKHLVLLLIFFMQSFSLKYNLKYNPFKEINSLIP